MTNSRNEFAPIYRGILIDSFGGKCEGCGTDGLGLEFAHVKETDVKTTFGKSWHDGRGRKERQTDVAKHRECYLLTCSDCHDILTAWERKNERLAGSREAALAIVRQSLNTKPRNA